MTVALLTVVPSALGTAAPSKPSLDAPLVITQVPVKNRNASQTPSQPAARLRSFEGARLALVMPDDILKPISQGFHSACDPDVSFDGSRILFSGKKEANSPWRIWEMDLDGGGLRAVSPEKMEAAVSPIYVSTLFTLDSPEPWFTTVFTGVETGLSESGRPTTARLFNIKLDGTELRRLTFNPGDAYDPVQMWDGRVICSSEKVIAGSNPLQSRIGLRAIHVEGADMESYGGELGGPKQHMACSVKGRAMVFVEPQAGAWDGAGLLACVEEARPHVTYKRLTEPGSYLYLYPTPLNESLLLVARRPSGKSGNTGLFVFDLDNGQVECVFDSPDYHDVQAKVVRPRPRPDGHSTVVNPRSDKGTFYGLNAYDVDKRMAGHLPAGTVKRVRLIEGVPQKAPVAGAPLVPRRLIGEAPVEADGSFNIEVPADTPMTLQTLDERGLALATCDWIWVKPKETRGCIGCHEDPERIPENEYVLALRRPSNSLMLKPEQRRGIGFVEDVAPLLKTHCATADCHGGRKSDLRLPVSKNGPTEADLTKWYSALVQSKGKSAAGKYVDPGRARASWLVWQLMGTNTSRAWDMNSLPAAAKSANVNLMPPEGHSEQLSPEQVRTIVQWIDLGAQFRSFTTHTPSPASQSQ